MGKLDIVLLLFFVILLSYCQYPIDSFKQGNKKVLTWIIHMYPPYHNAGAEWMAHAINKSLIKQGYRVYVFIPKNDIGNTKKIFLELEKGKAIIGKQRQTPTVYQGVEIYSLNDLNMVRYAIDQSSLLCSHLDFSENTRRLAKRYHKPYLHILHNSFEYAKIKRWREDRHPTYLVANSNWIADVYRDIGYKMHIVYPPTYWRDYFVKDDKKVWVTLINLCKLKGGELLIRLAKAMPNVQFAGVKGAYNSQIVDRSVKNITYLDNTPDIKTIYAKTKILIMPSTYESWGRTAVEAMSSGIPVIANNTPGLSESTGKAGIMCDINNFDLWVKHIRRLLSDSKYYKQMSNLARDRAKALDPHIQLQALAAWIEKNVIPAKV